MRHLTLLLLWLPACDIEALEIVEEGFLELDGERCSIDQATSLGFGPCLQSEGVLSAQGSGSCGDVTAWLDPLLSDGGDAELQVDSTDVAGGRGAIWVSADQDRTWTTSSGTATVYPRTDGALAITFSAQLEDFLDGSPGPTASGLVLCDER